MAVALLGMAGGIGDARKGGEFGSRERRRDGDHANAGGQLRDIRAIRSRADAVGTETLNALHSGPERQLHDLRRVDHRATAHGHEQVGTKPPRLGGAGDYALTWRMGRDPCEDANAACSIVLGQTLREAVRSGEGGGAGDHQAMGAEGLGEIGQRFQRWPAVDHLLLQAVAMRSAKHAVLPKPPTIGARV